MIKKSHLLFIGLVLSAAVVVTGCGTPEVKVSATGAQKNNIAAVEQYVIKAQEGGAVALEPGDGSRVKIVFPQDALNTDATLEIAPRKENGEDVLSTGFSLEEKGSGQGPKLKYPALLFIYADKDLGQDVSIVNYKDDGSYDVVPTRVSVKDGKTALLAQVMHFSEYGARRVSAQAIKQAKDGQKPSDFNWVIYVKDSYNVDSGPMKRKVTLDFKAMNTSGDIAGKYVGYSRAKTSNDMEAGGGKIDADFQLRDENVTFEIGPYFELAPLVKNDDPLGLAALKPAKEPDYLGQGTLSMTGAGSGTVQAGGRKVTSGIEAEASNDKFNLAITGPLVRLSVSVQGIGTLYFNGYIRGEGK